LDFLLVVGQLKTEKRTGWQYMKVPAPESVADHMYRMAIMALVIGDCAGDGFKKERAMKIALCHDMSEALCGDITPSDNVSKQEKNHLETEAMEHIRGVLTGKPGVGQELLDLWSEYEYQSSPESKYVKDFDKLEMCIQAFEYESVHADIDLSEFYESTQSKLKVPLMQTMFARLLERRKAIKHSA
jgi:putative hydrolase of HD superfamily